MAKIHETAGLIKGQLLKGISRNGTSLSNIDFTKGRPRAKSNKNSHVHRFFGPVASVVNRDPGVGRKNNFPPSRIILVQLANLYCVLVGKRGDQP